MASLTSDIDIVFLVDTSGSMSSYITKVQNALNNFISIITLGVDESDEDNPKWYASTGVSVKATPTAAADNTVYLPSLTNFSASWDSSQECVILTWKFISERIIL